MSKSGTTRVKVGSNSDVGIDRPHNEDSLLWWEPDAADGVALARRGRLYVVADGMGGHDAGEVASKIAVETIVREYPRDDSDADATSGDATSGNGAAMPAVPGEDIPTALRRAIRSANAEIHEQSKPKAPRGMGTTVVCAVVHGDSLYVAHVGDSRAYLFRDGELQALTHDHSLVNEQVRAGLMTREEAQVSEHRNVLTRALGIRAEVSPDLTGPLPLQPGDVVLLCSDGICGYVSIEQMEYALQANPADPQAVADFLVQAANAAGGYDNATALLVLIEEVAPAILPITVPAASPMAPVAALETAPSATQPHHSPLLALSAPRLASHSPLPLLILTALALLTGLVIGMMSGVGAGLTLGLPALIDVRARQLPPTPAALARTAANVFRGTPLPDAQAVAPLQAAPVVTVITVAPPTVAPSAPAVAERTSSEGGGSNAASTATPATAAPATVTAVPTQASAATQAEAETQAAQDIQWVTCAISLQPQAPLTSAAELPLMQIALPAGQISDITITLKTNATVIEPLTLTGEAEMSGNGAIFQLLLVPQVNFNRDDQVNIEVAVTGPAAAQPEPIGTVILQALPALRANTPLNTVLTLRPLGVDPNGNTKVRLTAQWISDNSVPGEFKPDIATGLPVE